MREREEAAAEGGEDELEQQVRAMIESDCGGERKNVRILAHISEDDKEFFARIKSVKKYMGTCLEAQKGEKRHPMFAIGAGSERSILSDFYEVIQRNREEKRSFFEGCPPVVKQIGLESIIYRGTEVGENTSIQKSSVSNHVRIGLRCKIVNSVILPHVVIGNDCLI